MEDKCKTLEAQNLESGEKFKLGEEKNEEIKKDLERLQTEIAQMEDLKINNENLKEQISRQNAKAEELLNKEVEKNMELKENVQKLQEGLKEIEELKKSNGDLREKL